MPATELGSSDRLLTELRLCVERETPTTDAGAVNAMMNIRKTDLGTAGGAITRRPGRDGFGDTLICRTPGQGAPIVFAGHLDTVWDHGTLTGAPAPQEHKQWTDLAPRCAAVCDLLESID